MGYKKIKSKETKTENIHIRLTKREKKRLCKRAKELDVSISDCIRILTLKKEVRTLKKAEYCKLAVWSQDLVTYVQQRYGREEDQELIERIDKVWELLTLF